MTFPPHSYSDLLGKHLPLNPHVLTIASFLIRSQDRYYTLIASGEPEGMATYLKSEHAELDQIQTEGGQC